MRVSYNDDEGYDLDQELAIEEMLREHGMASVHSVRTPIGAESNEIDEASDELLPTSGGDDVVTVRKFQSLVGSLILDVAEFLLEHTQAAVNVQDEAGWTPLMSAASAGHGNIVGLLLSKGADANVPNENGQIPLHYHRGRQEIAELLLDYTRDVNQADNIGSTPLMRAMGGKPSPVIIALLLDHGAKVNTRDVGGNTPLHLAISEGYEDIARFLVENGANPNAKNKDEQRCVDLAKSAFRAEIQMLVAKKEAGTRD
ncbi:hypothetical protein KRP22_010430 [Phytophthora ramorum]|nr:26S proteasome non-ATPase regulatory subunit 10 [Phytophthora ramorum]